MTDADRARGLLRVWLDEDIQAEMTEAEAQTILLGPREGLLQPAQAFARWLDQIGWYRQWPGASCRGLVECAFLAGWQARGDEP